MVLDKLRSNRDLEVAYLIPRGMTLDAKTTAARAFVRSLNILLKFARLYGLRHTRTATQFQTAWSELRAALPPDNEAGLLLGATGSQLLIDGAPLDSTPAERNFAQLLSAAGVASIHFFPCIAQDELARFARAFPTGGAKPSAVAEQLKGALAGAAGIHINEICFVAADSSLREAQVAAQLTARTLGADADQFKVWLNDPQKLLQLIAAAEGAKGGSDGAQGDAKAATGTRAGTGGGLGGGTGTGPGAGAGPGGVGSGSGRGSPAEEDLFGILRLLTKFGQAAGGTGGAFAPGPLRQELSKMPHRAQDILRQALNSLAARTPTTRPDTPMLLRLAEHLAIRFALDRYERGEVRVNAVRQMLDRMGQEVEGLRKILGAHEDKLAQAGIYVESYADLLDRQFWSSVPEAGKRSVLTSPEAWCIPPRNVRQYVEELFGRALEVARNILSNYATCITNTDPQARRKTALGLSELAELYASANGELLANAIRKVGAQVRLERDTELQSLISAAFVRLSQEAATRHCYPAMQQALESLESVEQERPSVAQNLRPRIGVEDRLPEFIEEAVRSDRIPAGLADVLRGMPRPAADHLMGRFNRCGYRDDCDRLIELARELGGECVSHLRETLRDGLTAEAVETVGMLSRLDAPALEEHLPARIREWQRLAHDRVVRQLAAGGAPERGSLLLAVFDDLDLLIMPLALDEIGMSGDRSTVPRLVRLAEGELPKGGGPYLRLKAVEALGRLRAQAAAKALQEIAEAKQVWRWVHPGELRIAAAQALEKIDPEWAREALPRMGLNPEELSLAALDPVPGSLWARQRRYARLRMSSPLAAITSNLKENCRLEIKTFGLSGGVAATARHLAPGTQATLKLQSGLRGVRPTVLMRDYRAQDMAFEIVDMDLEERYRLRRTLTDLAGSSTLVLPAPGPGGSHRISPTPR